jgi:hypothetical protein
VQTWGADGKGATIYLQGAVDRHMTGAMTGAMTVPGLATIIRAELQRSGKGLRELTHNKIITERTRRNFYERLEGGLLSTAEIVRIQEFLGIDPVRVTIAVMIMKDPMAYFDACCETLVTMTEELGPALQKQVEAIRGDFTPIHRNLCRAQASKLAREMANHSERVQRLREGDFD